MVNRFGAISVKDNTAEKRAFVWSESVNYIFAYSIRCTAPNARVYFDLKKSRVMVVLRNSNPALWSKDEQKYDCFVTGFWVNNDMPSFDCQFLIGQGAFIDSFVEQFKEQYAAYLLDNIINS